MGAVVTYNTEIGDEANLLPPEGRQAGSAMAVEIERYVDDLRRKVLLAHMRDAREKGEPFNPYTIDLSVGNRAAIPEELFPEKVIVASGGIIPDFYSNFGFYFVSAAFKELVHEFDGDIHQFVPVEVVDANGSPCGGSSVYFFKCRQVLNAVDETSENIKISDTSSAQPGDLKPFTFTAKKPFRMLKGEIGSAGIWQELRCPMALVASEAFLTEFNARGLTGIARYGEFEEV